jgi:hypothetical protein
MGNWEEQLAALEHYMVRINNPRAMYRLRSWVSRLVQIKKNPECTCLDDLGASAPYTIDLSVLYPQRRRAA